MIKGIHFANPAFGNADSSTNKEHLRMSTVFWAPYIITDSNGEADVTVDANTVGRIANIVEGYSVHGAIYGKFIVRIEEKKE